MGCALWFETRQAVSGQGVRTDAGVAKEQGSKGAEMAGKKDVVQVKNPRTNRYVKIDRDAGKIVSAKKTKGPYKNVPVARKKK